MAPKAEQRRGFFFMPIFKNTQPIFFKSRRKIYGFHQSGCHGSSDTRYRPRCRSRGVGHKIKKYPEDEDLLEDVIVENKQAIEMASIYSGILSGSMDAFASIISNNLNQSMKFLATVTIVLSIPTMVASFYGMNVSTSGMPFADSPFGFLIVIGFSIILSFIVSIIFWKKDLF